MDELFALCGFLFLTVSLKLLQFRWAQALVHAWFRHVAKWRNDVAIPVKADLLAHLKATEKQAEIWDNL